MIGGIMRINVIALIAVAFTIVALFLPWLAGYQVKMLNFDFIDSFNLSPFQWSVNSVLLSTGHMENVGAGTWQPKPLFQSTDWYLAQAPLTFSFLVSLLYLFAIGLMVQSSFVTDSWSKTGSRVSIAASNLLFLSIFMYTLSAPWALFAGVWSWGSLPPNSVWCLSLGFWLAIFGTGLAFASWLRPKFITVSIQPNSRVANLFRRWLPVADWQKAAVMTVASFLAVFIFTIIYLPIP